MKTVNHKIEGVEGQIVSVDSRIADVRSDAASV